MTTFPTEEKGARRLLNMASGLDPWRARRLIEAFGSAVAALAVPAEEWPRAEGMTLPLARRVLEESRAALPAWEKEASFLAREGIRILVSGDGEFPRALEVLPDPPLVLYIKGALEAEDALAVALVGSRRASPYGRSAAEKLAASLARAGVTVVSGLARGIDAAAHEAALKAGGRTIGVLGSGFHEFYPRENLHLADQMTKQGAVLTEHPLEAPPLPPNFPRRNRLVSGLALAVLVAEARERSGALITARLAAEQGKDVFAVPGSIFSEGSRGAHFLLRQGARPVEDARDVLEEVEALQPLARSAESAPPAASSAAPPTPDEAAVLRHLSWDPVAADTVAGRTGLPAGSLAAALLSLEVKGWVRALPGRLYARSAQAEKGTPSRS